MPPPSPQSNQDNSMAILWVVVALMAVCAAIWFFLKVQIIYVFLNLKLLEINYFLNFFTHRLDETAQLIRTILASDLSQVTFNDINLLGSAVGSYLRYPMIVVILFFAAIIFLISPVRSFKNVYTMKSLANLEKTNWPQTTPILNLNLVKQDVNKGPWAMALLPMQFCKRYGLLQEFRAEGNDISLQQEARIEVSLKRGEANRVFAMQLGPLWPGIQRVPPHVRALFAAFAGRINGDSEAVSKLFTYINRSSSTKLDFSLAEPLIKKHSETPIVKKILNAHAYLLTVLAEMLEAARSDGVQASADFLWLKPVDRRLWYMLNTVGRQTPFPEVAGPFAHWIAEKRAGRKLIIPMVEEATNALEVMLKEVIYRPDEG